MGEKKRGEEGKQEERERKGMGMKEEGCKEENKTRQRFPIYKLTSNGYKAVSYIGTQIKYCLLNVDCSCLEAVKNFNIIYTLISQTSRYFKFLLRFLASPPAYLLVDNLLCQRS